MFSFLVTGLYKKFIFKDYSLWFLLNHTITNCNAYSFLFVCSSSDIFLQQQTQSESQKMADYSILIAISLNQIDD